LGVLQKNQPVLLKRVREIRRPRFLREKVVGELGSLVVIAYKVPEEAQHEKISNFLKRAPCIRLCRSVYAFYQEHTRFDKDRELVDARRFWDFIREIDEDAAVIPRVVVVNSDSVERLLKEAQERVEKEIDDIVAGYKSLCQKAGTGEIGEQYVHGALPKLNRRFATVRKIAAFYERWLRIDLSKSIIKPYPAMRKFRSLKMENRVREKMQVKSDPSAGLTPF